VENTYRYRSSTSLNPRQVSRYHARIKLIQELCVLSRAHNGHCTEVGDCRSVIVKCVEQSVCLGDGEKLGQTAARIDRSPWACRCFSR